MDQFAKVAKVIRTKISNESRLVGLANDRTRARSLMNFVNSPTMRMLDLAKGAFGRSTKGVMKNYKLSLEILLYMSTFSETTNERDTIYAQLNMASNTTSTSYPHKRPTLLSDYRESILDVYTDSFRHCCRHAKSLNILCQP
jgi:hypothetical protein